MPSAPSRAATPCRPGSADYSVGADTKLNLILAGDPGASAARSRGRPDAGTDEPASPTFTRAAAAMTPGWSAVTFSGRVVDVAGDPVAAR